MAKKYGVSPAQLCIRYVLQLGMVALPKTADPEHSAAYETIAGLRGYLRCLPGAKEKGIVYGTGTWDKGDVYQHPSFEKPMRWAR